MHMFIHGTLIPNMLERILNGKTKAKAIGKLWYQNAMSEENRIVDNQDWI